MTLDGRGIAPPLATDERKINDRKGIAPIYLRKTSTAKKDPLLFPLLPSKVGSSSSQSSAPPSVVSVYDQWLVLGASTEVPNTGYLTGISMDDPRILDFGLPARASRITYCNCGAFSVELHGIPDIPFLCGFCKTVRVDWRAIACRRR
ncbi:hypothetical protein B0H13DRAFT_1872162 [Mycena leptocephala]|nr:hypothetical protein B0H13DRAFT_1872162 [Mycena leptocephala]